MDKTPVPLNPTMYLNHITVTVLDDLYDVLKEAAAAKNTSVEALVADYVRIGLGLGPFPRLTIEALREKLIEEMKLYAKDAFNATGYFTQTEDRSAFAAIHVGKVRDERFVSVGLFARIMKDYIVIVQDLHDKQLADALLQAGVPRSQIILAYAGEPVPETA